MLISAHTKHFQEKLKSYKNIGSVTRFNAKLKTAVTAN
jgi:hypothetical protein